MGGVGLAELFGPSVEHFDGPQFGVTFVRNLVENGRNLMENVRNSIFYQLFIIIILPLLDRMLGKGTLC